MKKTQYEKYKKNFNQVKNNSTEKIKTIEEVIYEYKESLIEEEYSFIIKSLEESTRQINYILSIFDNYFNCSQITLEGIKISFEDFLHDFYSHIDANKKYKNNLKFKEPLPQKIIKIKSSELKNLKNPQLNGEYYVASLKKDFERLESSLNSISLNYGIIYSIINKQKIKKYTKHHK